MFEFLNRHRESAKHAGIFEILPIYENKIFREQDLREQDETCCERLYPQRSESTDRTEKTAGKLRSAAAIVLVAGSGFFRSGVCGEVFDIPTVDAGGGAVPSFIAAVLPAETDSEIAVLKIDGDGRLADDAAQCIHWDADCFELCVLLNEKKTLGTRTRTARER